MASAKRKSKSNSFSSIEINQAHQQNNKIVKVDGGSIELLENENVLLKWAVADPIIGNVLEQFAEHHNRTIKYKHRKDTNSFEKGFLKERKYFFTAFLSLGTDFSRKFLRCYISFLNMCLPMLHLKQLNLQKKLASNNLRHLLQNA